MKEAARSLPGNPPGSVPEQAPAPVPHAVTATAGIVEFVERRFVFRLENCLGPDASSLFLCGWSWDPGRQLDRLELAAGKHTQAVPASALMRFPRPDVAAHCKATYSDDTFDNHGFLFFLPLETPLVEAGVLRVVRTDGWIAEFPLDPVPDPFLTQRRILEALPPEPIFNLALLRDHIAPALERTRAGVRRLESRPRSFSFGAAQPAPELTMIVPLYKRLDLMEQQLAQFANDPAMGSAELVYVLDDPSVAAEFEIQAFRLWQIYRVPFKTVVMERHSGYAAANNAGCAESSGTFLLFLNSDVFPAGTGWTTHLLAVHESTPRMGALGCKLLYEDRSIQHAGMYFIRDYSPNKLWTNMHYFKGLPRDWPEAGLSRAVPAVTGAAMLVRRSAFEQVGGWDESYIMANFEDSDLCLRFASSGYANWYCAEVELYHLESQSQREPDALRDRSDLYNRWLQTHRWGSFIEDVMVDYGPGSRFVTADRDA